MPLEKGINFENDLEKSRQVQLIEAYLIIAIHFTFW